MTEQNSQYSQTAPDYPLYPRDEQQPEQSQEVQQQPQSQQEPQPWQAPQQPQQEAQPLQEQPQQELQSSQQQPVHTNSERSYEGSPWINVWDFQVKEHVRHDDGKHFWSCKLLDGTSLELNGERRDVSHYQFSMNVEPALTHGEAGSPKAVRGIHFPTDWDITLRRVENVAKEGENPVFKETDRIEGVTPKQLATAIEERNEAWRNAHRKDHGEQDKTHGKDAHAKEQRQFEKTRSKTREAEPSL